MFLSVEEVHRAGAQITRKGSGRKYPCERFRKVARAIDQDARQVQAFMAALPR
jgi:hypothetical protein